MSYHYSHVAVSAPISRQWLAQMDTIRKARREPVNWLHVLPREPRDMVYMYALSEDGGLEADLIHEGGPPLYLRAVRAGTDKSESNQLRLTCRQLYEETSGLGLRYNDITFIDTNRTGRVSAYQHFARFIEIVSRKHLMKLNRVIILEGRTGLTGPAPQELLRQCCHASPVQRFCQNFPELNVVVRVDWAYRMTGDNYLQVVSVLLNALIHGRPGIARNKVELIAEPLTFTRPNNLHFSCTFEFMEEWVRPLLEHTYAGKELENAVGKFRQVHERGI